MRKFVTATLALGVTISIGGTATVEAEQAPPAVAQSVAAVKQVVDLMTQTKRECVVMDGTVFGGYVGALLVPGAKLTVVSARFADTTSMVYKLYQKDCMGAYADLTAAVDAMDRVIIDDISANGLIAMPKTGTPRDAITRDGKTIKLDGDKAFLKQSKITLEDYSKAFAGADETYSQLLLLLSKELKK